MFDPKTIDFYPLVIDEKIRFSDTDRQGHVNNVNFSFFYESGRSDLLDAHLQLFDSNCHFSLATIIINFTDEIRWPGHVDIATGVESVGESSTSFRQALFQGGRCVSTSTSTMVQINTASRLSQPLSRPARSALAAVACRGIVIPPGD